MEGVISRSDSTESQIMTKCECVCVLQRPKRTPRTSPKSRSLMTKLVHFNIDRKRLQLACSMGKTGGKDLPLASFLTGMATALGTDPFLTEQLSPPREGSPRPAPPRPGVPAPALRGELGASTWKGFQTLMTSQDPEWHAFSIMWDFSLGGPGGNCGVLLNAELNQRIIPKTSTCGEGESMFYRYSCYLNPL